MTDNRRADATGRSTSRPMGGKNAKAEQLERPFVGLTLRMKQSPAWRVLPDRARRVLDRLEVEHMLHGAAENGNLPCTHRQFIEWGVPKETKVALLEAEALGFIRVTAKGLRKFGGAPGRATRFRLTYLPTREAGRSEAPTQDWQSFASIRDAQAALDKVSKKRPVKRVSPSEAATAPSVVAANDRGAA